MFGFSMCVCVQSSNFPPLNLRLVFLAAHFLKFYQASTHFFSLSNCGNKINLLAAKFDISGFI